MCVCVRVCLCVRVSVRVTQRVRASVRAPRTDTAWSNSFHKFVSAWFGTEILWDRAFFQGHQVIQNNIEITLIWGRLKYVDF